MIPRPTILIADDHPGMVEAVQAMLRAEFDVVGTASHGAGLIQEAARLSPDVLIVDIGMPGMTGIEAVQRLSTDGCDSIIVMLTTFDEAEVVERAMKSGARGYVRKNRMGRDLIPAIRAVLEGHLFVSEA